MTSSPTPSPVDLSAANYSVHRVGSAEAAQSALAAEEFALAVIDVGLPGADGLTLVRRLRSAGNTMPTLILTARCTLSDKVKALDIGADDFLSKPFEPAELAARCRALMRRSSGALDGIIKLNRMSVDLMGRRLCIDEAEVELTAREWLVLECLVRRTGQIVSKERVQQAARRSRAGHHAERRRSARLAVAGQTGQCRGDPQPARPRLSTGRSESRVSSSISRQLVLWLAVPLMLLALCGALVHYFNNVAPGVISSDRRLKEAANALMARIAGRAPVRSRSIPAATASRPCPLPTPSRTRCATRRDACCSAMRNCPLVSMADASGPGVRHGAARPAATCARSRPDSTPARASSSSRWRTFGPPSSRRRASAS